jgi:two-component system OmpR family response regulator
MIPVSLQKDAWWLSEETVHQEPPAALKNLLPQAAEGTVIRMKQRVLIVDDDAHIREVIKFALEDTGFDVAQASTGVGALSELSKSHFDLVLLDIGMPEMDGFQACKAIRMDSHVPIIFLTARDDEIDRVLGFELGADDYVAKPFSPRELVLRVKAILKRSGETTPKPTETNFGVLSLNQDAHMALINGVDMALTAREFALLACMVAAPTRVFSKIALIDQVYGNNIYLSDRTVDSHIRNLRAKARALGCDNLISTIHGIGMKMGACTC